MRPAHHELATRARPPIRTAWLVADNDPMPELRPVRFAAEHHGVLAIDRCGGLAPVQPVTRAPVAVRTRVDGEPQAGPARAGSVHVGSAPVSPVHAGAGQAAEMQASALQRAAHLFSPSLPRAVTEHQVALLVSHGTQCFLVDMGRRRAWHRLPMAHVQLNGAPLVGGIASVRHGDWITVRGATTRIWLSHEGPWPVVPARPGDSLCALSLEPIALGAPIVRCGCSAVFLLDNWREARRCCRCGAVEDGHYRLLPPGITEARRPRGGRQ